MLRQSNFVKFFLSILVVIVGSTNCYAYTMGPYLTAGGGASNFSFNLLGHHSETIGNVNLGGGYLWPISKSEYPFFIGVQGDAISYFGATAMQVYGADISGIIGKEVTSNVAVYSKMGADSLIFNTEDGKDIVAGPLIGVGVGYQATSNLRFTTEANYSLIGGFYNKATVTLNLQYAFD